MFFTKKKPVRPASPGSMRYLRARHPEKTDAELRRVAAQALAPQTSTVRETQQAALLAEGEAALREWERNHRKPAVNQRDAILAESEAALRDWDRRHRKQGRVRVPAHLHHRFMAIWRAAGRVAAAEFLKKEQGVQS